MLDLKIMIKFKNTFSNRSQKVNRVLVVRPWGGRGGYGWHPIGGGVTKLTKTITYNCFKYKLVWL